MVLVERWTENTYVRASQAGAAEGEIRQGEVEGRDGAML